MRSNAASLSVIVLAIAALFLVVEKTAVTLIWEVRAVRVPSRWAYAVPVAVVGTLLLVWGKRRWGDIPHTTRDVLGAPKRGEAINYHTAWRDLLIALIILAAGAGVGPEASLMGAVIAYSVWQCDKLRYLRTHADSVRATPIPTRLACSTIPRDGLSQLRRPQLPLSLQATRPAPPMPHLAMQPPQPPKPRPPLPTPSAPSARCRGASTCR